MKFALFGFSLLASSLFSGCKTPSGAPPPSPQTTVAAHEGPLSARCKPFEGVPDGSGSSKLIHLEAKVESGGEAPTHTKVAIIGAGLTGLTAAYELKKAGIESVVLEAEAHVGGRINTIQFTDCATAEAHMEEFFERSPAFALIKELKLPVAPDVAHSSVRIRDKIYVFADGKEGEDASGHTDRDAYLDPIFNAAEKKAFLDWSHKVWKVYERLHGTISSGVPVPADLRPLMEISFKDYVLQAKLPDKVNEWIRVVVEPETAIEWDMISALDGIDEVRLFLDSPSYFGEQNVHVEGGNINFIRALVKSLPAGSIRTSSRVTRVEHSAKGAVVSYLLNGQEKRLHAEHVVVTVPMSVIGKIAFKPALDAKKKKAIESTRFGSYVKVHYRVDPELRKTPGWNKYGESLFTFLSDTPAGSIYNATSFEGIGPQDTMVITLLVHARFARPLLQLSPVQVGERLKKEMDALIPGFSQHVVDTATYIYPKAVAYWPVKEGRSRFDDLALELRKPQGRVYIGGDTTEDSHSEGAVQAAMRMAKLITARYPDKKKSE